MSNLLLPGDIGFYETLAAIPPNWREVANKTGGSFAFVADSQSGLLKAVNGTECKEYLLGGEYFERLDSMYEPEEDDFTSADLEGVDEIYIDWDFNG